MQNPQEDGSPPIQCDTSEISDISVISDISEISKISDDDVISNGMDISDYEIDHDVEMLDQNELVPTMCNTGRITPRKYPHTF